MARNDDLAKKFFENGTQITACVTVQRPASQIYDAWAGLTGFPRFVDELESVTASANNRVMWKSRGEESSAAWETEILRQEPGRMWAWRTVGDPAVPNAGSVTLRELPFRRGTEMRVVVEYIPPQGKLGQSFARAMGRDPKEILQLALFRFRQWMETGEVATTRGQPAGRNGGRDEEGSKDERKLAEAENR